MANAYTNQVTTTTSAGTKQARIVDCELSVQINPGDTILLTPTNAIRLRVEMVILHNVATGNPYTKPAGATGTGTAVQCTAFAAGSAGDGYVACFATNGDPGSLSARLDKVSGSAMTAASAGTVYNATPGAGGTGQYIVNDTAITGRPAITLTNSHEWAASGVGYHNNGTMTLVSNSAAELLAWETAAQSTSQRTLTIPASCTGAVSDRLILFIYSDANTGTNTITDTASGAAPANTVAPVISGTQKMGSTLSSTTGTWTGDVSSGYAYQWKRGGSSISGATSSTYVLTGSDFGAATAIKCTVTATGLGGSASADSNTLTGFAGNYTIPSNNIGIWQLCANDAPSVYTQGATAAAVSAPQVPRQTPVVYYYV